MAIAPFTGSAFSRRTFLAATAAGAGGLALTACTTSGSSNPNPPPFDKNAITSR